LAQNYLKLQARNIFYGAGLSHLVAIESNILSFKFSDELRSGNVVFVMGLTGSSQVVLKSLFNLTRFS